MRVVICGPNLNDQSKGQYHVHAEGCADLRRMANREPEYTRGWAIDAETRDDAVMGVYEDMILYNDQDPIEFFRHDLHFFPCCASLPQE